MTGTASACGTASGVRWIGTSATTSAAIMSTASGALGCATSPTNQGPGAVVVYQGQLYASFQSATASVAGIYTIGSGTPQSATQTATQLSGISGGTPWSFVFASPNLLYVADSAAPATAHFYPYTKVGSTWTKGAGVKFLSTDNNPCYSITGQYDSLPLPYGNGTVRSARALGCG